MYWLRLTCPPEAVDRMTGELWAFGTLGIRELESDGAVVLIAHFDNAESRHELISRFRIYAPEWGREKDTDWLHETHSAWTAREVGQRLFLAPSWNTEATPAGRQRVIHNPGLACGTGEHPCSQLALRALEKCVYRGSSVVDIGTGSGILAIAARRLGARLAIGLDTDLAALEAARGNFDLNALDP
ncbi:MAG: 50S ribosomal protein L11 methyltransferase, partial [Acidobacteriaceae bacterium]|nr:50S ribosomal protein L11 methyltransferase [Acidobacteriaceae bacterium]